MTQTPTLIPLLPTQLLQNAVQHVNAHLQHSGDRPMALYIEDQQVTLSTDLTQEIFVLHGHTLTGRGGRFNLLDRTEVVQAMMTVQPTAPLTTTEGYLGLPTLAAGLGFRVYVGRMLRWKYSCLAGGLTEEMRMPPSGHS